MGLVEHISRYFLAHPNEAFESGRRFYNDNLNGEDLHDAIRAVNETEKDYAFLSKYLPTIVDVAAAVCYFATSSNYFIAVAGVAETWRIAEMHKGFLYDFYSKKLVTDRRIESLGKSMYMIGRTIDGLFDSGEIRGFYSSQTKGSEQVDENCEITLEEFISGDEDGEDEDDEDSE